MENEADLAETVLAVKGHKDSSEVRYYPASVISGGVINGAMLSDKGGWGFAYNGERVIVFVNCTHRSLRGGPWYKIVSGLGLGAQ